LEPRTLELRRIFAGAHFFVYENRNFHIGMFKKFKAKAAAYLAEELSKNELMASLQSYLGVLSHTDAFQLAEEMKNLLWLIN
jgi:hypothetical protein